MCGDRRAEHWHRLEQSSLTDQDVEKRLRDSDELLDPSAQLEEW
jgi:hypothetical protein